MISGAAPDSNSRTWNSALRLMLLRLKVHCHLPINFQCGAYYLAANGKPTHAAHHLVDCICLIAPPPTPTPHPPLHHCFFFYLYFAQQRAEKTLNAKKKKKRSISSFGVCLYVHHTSPPGREGSEGGVMLQKSTTPICLSVRCLAWLSSTQWWCWQNDRRGAHSSECQFGCNAQKQWCSHTPKQIKKNRGGEKCSL